MLAILILKLKPSLSALTLDKIVVKLMHTHITLIQIIGMTQETKTNCRWTYGNHNMPV